MKRIFFLLPIIGITAFAARGWRYADLDYTVFNVLVLGASNGITIGFLICKFLIWS